MRYPDGFLGSAHCAANGNRLKTLVLTHSDGDHYNLVKSLIKDGQVEIGTIFIGGENGDYGDIAGWLATRQGELQAASIPRQEIVGTIGCYRAAAAQIPMQFPGPPPPLIKRLDSGVSAGTQMAVRHVGRL